MKSKTESVNTNMALKRLYCVQDVVTVNTIRPVTTVNAVCLGITGRRRMVHRTTVNHVRVLQAATVFICSTVKSLVLTVPLDTLVGYAFLPSDISMPRYFVYCFYCLCRC